MKNINSLKVKESMVLVLGTILFFGVITLITVFAL
jgi:hypothetical protein